MSLTLGLNTALSGLMTSQRGLDVIAQNVANVNTVGYTRKVMNPESRVLAGRGAGVQEGSVSRIVDEGLLKDIRRQTSTYGRLETEQKYYPRIQDMFGEVGDDTSIAHQLQRLFEGFESLANNVQKPSLQWAGVQAGLDVSEQLGKMTAQLQSLRHEADREIEQAVALINQKLEDILDLNKKIVRNGAISADTGDLLDKRDQALTELSELVDIQYFGRSDGSVIVYTGAGTLLVDNDVQPLSYNASTSVTPSMSAASGQFNKITSAGGTEDVGATIRDGKLRALLDLRDTQLPNLQAQVDELSQKLREQINLVHNRGTSYPSAMSSYSGTRIFAKQGDVVQSPAGNPDTSAVIYGRDGLVIDAAAYGQLTFGNDDGTASYRATLTATTAGSLSGLTVGSTFSIANAEDNRNNGTYRVTAVNGNQVTVEKVNVRQTMALTGNEDVAIALFDSEGAQIGATTLRAIMQTDFTTSSPYAYDPLKTGSGRSTADFEAKSSSGPWSIAEVSAHMEAWLRNQGYTNASVNLDAEGKMQINTGSTSVSLAFRDQVSSAPGADQTDATIQFDVDGDGTSDETVKGFSNFFGLNDFFVRETQQSVMDTAIQPAGFKTLAAQTLRLYDASGQIGNQINIPAGSTLEEIAVQINRQTLVNESAVQSDTRFAIASPATFIVSDRNGNLTAASFPTGEVTLEQIAGALNNGSVNAQVVQDGNGYRLRITDSRGEPLTVTVTGGAITSSVTLGSQLDMQQVNRVQASVVPEGSGYRLRLVQAEGKQLYAASDKDGQGNSFLTSTGLKSAATGEAQALTLRKDIQSAPEKISRGSMRFDADSGKYYLSEGDNSTALALASAMNSKITVDSAGGIFKGKYTLAEYASASISMASSIASHSSSQYAYQTTLRDSLNFQHSAISGVNLDQEVASMIDFQQAYSASARVISVLQQMLEELVNIVK